MKRLRFLLNLLVCAVVCGLCTSCVHKVAHLPAGPLVISGQVVNAKGDPLPNSHLRLLRDLEYVTDTSDASGKFTFANLADASYLLTPWLDDCRFLPRRSDLHDLHANAAEGFAGFGLNCGGELAVNAGGATGPWTISGHLRDTAGNPIAGGRVELFEGEWHHHRLRAVRFSDFTGSYSFHSDPRPYGLHVSGACQFHPDHAEGDLHANVVHDFVGGAGCQSVAATNANPTGSVFTIRQGSTILGTTYVRVEQRASAADALARLKEIVNERPSTPSQSLTIAGYPAIERQAVVKLPGLDPDLEGNTGNSAQPFLAITTAIAAGSTVVRFESQISANSDAATIALFVQLGRNFNPDSLNELHGPPPATTPTVHSPPAPAPPVTGILLPGNMDPGDFGELQVGASDVANAVVYGTQNAPFVSTNGGQTISPATYNYINPPSASVTNARGDPTVTLGAIYGTTNQDFYFVQEETVSPPASTGALPTIATGLYRSTDNGQTFNNLSFPVNCGLSSAGCLVPDQEQLVADRLNRAVTSGGTADQLYITWRNFPAPNNGSREIGVACSKDGGKTWQTDLTTLNATGGDFGRPVVGPNGSLLVVFELFGSPTSTLKVQQWSSCASGFAPGVLGTLATITDVSDMPGLDRVTDGNYSLAFDSSDGSGQRVFGVYSNEASTGNDDIHGAESVDGGQTWNRDSIVSTSSQGRRYLPWLCSSVGKQFVTWYDRRDSTSAKTDLTAYYRSSIFDNGTATTVGVGTEKNVSGVDDPECASGFPSGTSGAIEEAGCKNLPSGFIQGGTCQATCATGQTGPCGSQAACDFRAATPCATAGETCQPSGGGSPKFGDYNGAACSQGVLYMAWASSTAPTGGGCLLNGVSSSSASKCCSGQLSGGVCAASSSPACTPNGGACSGSLPACCSATGANGRCQANKCLPAIGLYTSSTCIGPGCAGLPVQINYHQVGACNGYTTSYGITSAGPNQAYVIYRIDSIDNSGGSSTFNFDPGNFYVQQTSPSALDSPVDMSAIFGPFAATTATIDAGQDYQLSTGEYEGIIVQTLASNGATEADGRNYPLSYKRGSSDPPVSVVDENPGRTSWPLTEDCSTVVLQ